MPLRLSKKRLRLLFNPQPRPARCSTQHGALMKMLIYLTKGTYNESAKHDISTRERNR